MDAHRLVQGPNGFVYEYVSAAGYWRERSDDYLRYLAKRFDPATRAARRSEIVDFINLEYEVDIDDIKRQHRQEKADSGFQSIEYWIEQSGGDRASVLERLLERRRNMDPADITEAFEMGYGSKLL